METRRLRLPHVLTLALIAAATMMSATSFAKDVSREAALRDAEIRRFAANDAADAQALGELLDDGLEYTHSNGTLDSKTSFIQSLTSGTRDYVSSQPVIESVRIFGDVAVIRGKAEVVVVDGGKHLALHLGYTDVWLWKAHRWQMTAWRSVRLP